MGLCRVRAAVLRKVLKQVRDAPLKNLWGVVGGGGAGEVQKNIRVRES